MVVVIVVVVVVVGRLVVLVVDVVIVVVVVVWVMVVGICGDFCVCSWWLSLGFIFGVFGLLIHLGTE